MNGRVSLTVGLRKVHTPEFLDSNSREEGASLKKKRGGGGPFSFLLEARAVPNFCRQPNKMPDCGLTDKVAPCYHAVVQEATYSLEEIKRLIVNGEYRITGTSLDGAFALGFDDQDICECIGDYLDGTHFYKTMPSEKRPSLMQDVYRITYEKQPIYLKLQIVDERAVVISFKSDESA
jgi:hypothetical protein